ARRPVAPAVVEAPPVEKIEKIEKVEAKVEAEPLPRALAACARDLTEAARRGELDPVTGRRRELRELQYALVHRTRSNALLIGEPGVGKTSIVEALAQHVAAGDVHEALVGLRVVELSLTQLVAGTRHRGELEERIDAILGTAESVPELVLFIDEIHALAGGPDTPAATLAQALKPALARGKIRVIGATTNAEYERHLSRDEALTRRFANIMVPEPTPAETREMLAGLRARLEGHYRVRIDDSALDGAIDLATRYMPDRRHPDKSVDLLDRACARRMLGETHARQRRSPAQAEPITRRDVAIAVAERIGIPVGIVDRNLGEVLGAVEAGLAARIVGQAPALAAVNEALRRGHSPLHDPVKPIASLLLVGPTGVGKTATAKLIAELLYGRDALVRIDMSELSDHQAVSRLVGAAPGYAGHGDDGQLIGPVRRKPACVVLFDEIEKGHHDARMLLLQILSDGALTDARGRRTSFRETVVIMTTNLPLAAKKRVIGLGRDHLAHDTDDVDLAHRQALAAELTPELVGRIDAVVAYRALDGKDHAAIVDAVVAGFEARLRAQGVDPPFGEPVRARVLARLEASRFGVRDVERFAEQEISEALSSWQAGIDEPPRDVMVDSIRTRVQVAMLLVDVVGSTAILARGGEAQFVQLVRRLAEAVKCHATARDLQFLKCTGDGVLALYGSVDAALEMGRALGPHRGDPPVHLRRVIHFGRVRHGPMGDFLGVEMHRVFRIEAVQARDRIGDDGAPIPDAPFLISSVAREHLAADQRARLRSAGAFHLAGFGEPVELWLFEG
ncbi:MAG: AAA family ATPase, partial [Deltaproteobacteria bacterium]|nr:AAA family ATPase [Deltaproteobacteria bacterium]